MTVITVLLLCGIAACATLVFLVETVVAFWLQKQGPATHMAPRSIPITSMRVPVRHDEAA